MAIFKCMKGFTTHYNQLNQTCAMVRFYSSLNRFMIYQGIVPLVCLQVANTELYIIVILLVDHNTHLISGVGGKIETPFIVIIYS